MKFTFIYQKGFMEYEIELKLLTSENAGEVIETKLLPHLSASITKQTLILTNHYFDTSDRTLRKHDIGLRIRGNNQQFEQTLKTSGKSIGGLHQRPEYNVQLDPVNKQNVDVPDLRLFPLSAWPKTINIDELQTKIEILFTTHFERKVYLLEFSDGNIVELVWDLGQVKCGNKSTPICEVELELKKGSTSALFDVAKRIVILLPTTIGTDSKAALGYHLLDGLPVKKYEQNQQKITGNTQTSADEFVHFLTTQLQHFQMLSAAIRRQYTEELASNIQNVLFELVDSLANFTHHFPCSSLDRVHINLEKVCSDWSLILPQNNENDACSLLTRAPTTQVQLDIVQCLVEQPWSSKV
ncbi:CYTH domain-containing protein [uncultured Paraglaciecola sp.]|uniref:CYTH domain-containing protein n=1 Tax=uncultured Paraglaciecola sp. TaxID=1765024 RepID=UPI0025EE0671|nr:CYTH domain-containing protein [uncultured Paraglaciecola sp.]